MFGSIYSKATEIFGRAFLVSAFIPTLIVTAGMAAIVDIEWFTKTLSGWMGADLNEQVAGALLVLLFLYLLAFILFGIRDRITRFLSAGEFWALASIRRWRRIHYTQLFLDAQEAQRGAALAVAQATIWGIGGFDFTNVPKNVYLPRGISEKKVFRDLNAWLRKLDRERSAGSLEQELSAARRIQFSGLFLLLHRGAAFDSERARLAVDHFREICSAVTPAVEIASWCRQIQQVDYADLLAAFDRTLWAPPPRNVQPTALGNILIWAAVYSVKRYGIELEFLFPRLQAVIAKDFQAKIDDRQQFFDFSILLTFLSFAAGMAYVVFASYQLTVAHAWRHWQELLSAAAFAGGWFILGRVAYKLSLVAAREYVSVITSAIDLYRLPLLKALEIAVPKPWAEYDVWSELNGSIQEGAKPRSPWASRASIKEGGSDGGEERELELG
jgi:hypothetical protein